MEGFSEPEKAQLMLWNAQYREHGKGKGGWLTPADSAFISYAWRDDQRTQMAARLAQTFAQIGVRHFLDKKDVENRFTLWRERVGPALAQCTHFFLIVSPNLGEGDMVLREIEMAMNRWYLELFPVVICVAEPETSRALRMDPEVPLRLRFLLSDCPVMTFEEALDPRLLRYIVRQTRRQGKLQDWLTVLAGATALQRILRMRGIAEVDAPRSGAGAPTQPRLPG
jgi:hypothetical protein